MAPTFLPLFCPITISVVREITSGLCLAQARVPFLPLASLTSQQHSVQGSTPAFSEAFLSDFCDLHSPGVCHTASSSWVSPGNSSSSARLLNAGVPQSTVLGAPLYHPLHCPWVKLFSPTVSNTHYIPITDPRSLGLTSLPESQILNLKIPGKYFHIFIPASHALPLSQKRIKHPPSCLSQKRNNHHWFCSFANASVPTTPYIQFIHQLC